MSLLKSAVHRMGRWYVREICGSEFKDQALTIHNERSIEYRFALEAMTERRPKDVLDVGTGTTAWPHLLRTCGHVVTAIDNVRDYWPQGMVNRHWTVLDVDVVNPGGRLPGKFDAITCISVLEHIEDHARAIQTMAGHLATGGIVYRKFKPPFSLDGNLNPLFH